MHVNKLFPEVWQQKVPGQSAQVYSAMRSPSAEAAPPQWTYEYLRNFPDPSCRTARTERTTSLFAAAAAPIRRRHERL